ncbi:MAG: hypothetical protein JRN52_03115 [Nitrososphaerota archaeon]|nr:hypothetical protein [Nitrososphaerota archaeon]
MKDRDQESYWRFPDFNREGKFETNDIEIRDITLREGEQTADVAFNSDEKIRIAMSLSDAGVHQIQCGYASEDCSIVSDLKSFGCKSKLEIMCVGYSPNWKEQVGKAVECGADIVHFIFRSDDQHLNELGLDRRSAIRRVEEIVAHMKSMGAREMSFGPSFASRANKQFLIEFINATISGGVNQVVVSDSTGSMNPEGFAALVKYIKKNTGGKLAVHCHNDFGLALSNTIAGIKAGAQIVESSIAGLGERAGNVATEEVVLAMKFLYDYDLGIDPRRIADAARAVFSISKMMIPPLKPIIGANTFTQKLDIHVMTTRTKPWLHEPFDPQITGMNHRLVIGKRSGPIAVREKAKQLSIKLSDDKVDDIVHKVNAFSDVHKRALTDEEFTTIVEAN